MVFVYLSTSSAWNLPFNKYFPFCIKIDLQCVHGSAVTYRCIQLWEPSKHDVNPKSIESWLVFMNKLRNSVLMAVDRNLRKFDEKVRNIRDKRTESNWDLTEYFLCHVSTNETFVF